MGDLYIPATQQEPGVDARDNSAAGDSPNRRTASDWFADHGDLSYAVDHALAAGDATRAVDLVEQDETIGSVIRRA